MWDRATGKPIYNAIVWQDRRTHKLCDTLKKDGHEGSVSKRTGLLLDPYFSATKVAWILDNVPGVRKRAEKGELAFGTVDSYLIWRLTGGKRHATDATNASRTMLFNIRTNEWDKDLLKLFRVPASLLPKVDNADDFGVTDAAILGAAIPIYGVAGDQQAATIGQACFAPGMLKSTYGTGCFALLNTGTDLVRSKNRLLTHHRLPDRRRDDLCARGRDLHGRRVGAVAARHAEDHRQGVGYRRRWRRRPIRRRTSIWCRPLSGSGRRGGTPGRAARSWG